MSSLLPNTLSLGDIVGFHFPTADARHPHPGIVLKLFADEQREKLLSARKVTDDPSAQLCLLLMISHSPPAKEAYAEFIQKEYMDGTSLDRDNDLFVYYEHFDVAFIPGDEKTISSVHGPYLGRLSEDAFLHFESQFRSVQSYIAGRSFLRPSGLGS